MKKILIISRYDSKGSGSVAYNVYQGLKAAGHDTRLLVEYTEEKDPNVISLNRPVWWRWRGLITDWFKRFKQQANPLKADLDHKYAPYSLHEHIGWYRTASLIRRLPFKPDVIICLFLNGYVNSRNIFKLQQRTKARLLFYPMDMALMTGGCHYAWECTRYTGQCGRCPALRSRDPEDTTFRNLRFKERYLSQLDFTVLASGRQIAGQLAQSRLLRGRKIVTCVEPIDAEIFKPGDPLAARKHFGLDPARKVIFFGSHNVHDPRKGFTYLRQALDLLYQRLDPAARDNVCVLLAGNNDPALPATMPFPCLSTGLLEINRTLPLAYQAATVFACASVQDSGPMMINQSILCGTPVVAFAQGAALDLVVPGETGHLARMCDPEDFARGLALILGLDAAGHARMRQSCRAKGLAECSIARAAGVIDALVRGDPPSNP